MMNSRSRVIRKCKLLSFDKIKSTKSTPGNVGTCQTGRQTMLGSAYFGNGCANLGTEFRQIMWSKVRGRLADMGPNKLHWIELRRTDWKAINV